MNYKQKFGYTLLGAGIMAVGIIIGQVITPDILKSFMIASRGVGISANGARLS